MSVAVITGASQGLGEALAGALTRRGWDVVIDARSAADLCAAADRMKVGSTTGRVITIPGDVAHPDHRRQIVDAAQRLGGIDLLVNNASTLGPSPLHSLSEHPLDVLRHVYDVNVVAPIALIQLALPVLRAASRPRILNVTSDASVEAYEGWGGYGSSKAALDHASAVLGAEEPDVRIWVVDPGDMRTRMHQEAFPGEDISDRPLPESVVPALVDLIDSDRPSGRYRAADLVMSSVSGDQSEEER
jgi:NAD(P)-dependent dehydrogenase (short-subunit alcohol dehydrogenase family)